MRKKTVKRTNPGVAAYWARKRAERDLSRSAKIKDSVRKHMELHRMAENGHSNGVELVLEGRIRRLLECAATLLSVGITPEADRLQAIARGMMMALDSIKNPPIAGISSVKP